MEIIHTHTPLLEFIAPTVTDEDLTKAKAKLFIVQHETGEDRVFNYDKDTNYYVVSRNDYYSITLNNASIEIDSKTYGGEDLICADASDGSLIDRKDDFCSSTGSGKYYKCLSGKCTSYQQSSYNDKESNDEKCIYDESKQKYTGSCVQDVNYLVSGNEIVEESSTSGKIKVLDTITESIYYSSSESDKNDEGYYINGDPKTKVDYPLIICENQSCYLKKPESGLGYYITGDNDADATII